MAGRTKFKADNLTVKVGATDYTFDGISVSLTSSEASEDVTTFADAAAGGSYEDTLSVTAIQTFESGSFWRFLWDNPGQTVAFVIAPFGNTTPSATQPHVTGNIKVTAKRPEFGGSAGATWQFTESFKATNVALKVS